MTAHEGHSSTSTTDSMDMSDSSMSMTMTAESMVMTFFSSTKTPLYSTMWTPTSAGAYAGTCIFIIVLAIMYRGGFTVRNYLEQKWLEASLKRRYVVVADKNPVAERVAADTDSKTGILTANGVEENVKIVQTPGRHIQPWRFSTDLPRALLMTVIAGMGYLLMLAVMTLNVGYFMSVLAGTLIGEIVFGRFNQANMAM